MFSNKTNKMEFIVASRSRVEVRQLINLF